jgi:cytochrome c-type biogenesis protein CcmH
MRILAALFAFLVLAQTAFAVEPDELLPDPAQEARARALTQELRCVVCQNQSVDDSDAPLAHDIRVLVRERIRAGDSDDDVRAYIVERYGRYVLLKPPFAADTALLWLGPVILLLIAGALSFLYVRGLNRAAPTGAPLSASDEEKVKRILDEAPK